jgi:hypothetical protein
MFSGRQRIPPFFSVNAWQPCGPSIQGVLDLIEQFEVHYFTYQ